MIRFIIGECGKGMEYPDKKYKKELKEKEEMINYKNEQVRVQKIRIEVLENDLKECRNKYLKMKEEKND